MKDKPPFITLNNASSEELSSTLNSYVGISQNAYHSSIAARDTYVDIETDLSVRESFTRADYDYFRPNEKIPSRPKDIIKMCMAAYRKIGVVRNIIDLMADFGSQGARISHSNPKIQKFYRGWFKLVRGAEVSERFLNNLFKCGQAVPQRLTGKLSPKIKRYITSLSAKVDEKVEVPVEIAGIPSRYLFLNPLSIDPINSDLSVFLNTPTLVFKIPRELCDKIKNPKTAIDKELVKKLPSRIVEAAKNGGNYLLDDSVSIYYYKKDDWQTWADPILYCILDDLLVLEKMKLADLAALDTVISQIRVWKLGDLDHELLPTNEAIDKLRDILVTNVGGGSFDLIWGPDLKFESTTTDMSSFLGKEKYAPVKDSIYEGLGVPSTLTGASTTTGSSSNYFSLKTLIKRLEYGRAILTEFWESELYHISKLIGVKEQAVISYDNMILTDEAAQKALLVQLVDRGILSDSTLLERIGEDAELEKRRLVEEEMERENNTRVARGGPWHVPEKDFQLMKTALGRGAVTPEQAGLEFEGKSVAQEQQEMAVKESVAPKDGDKPTGVQGQGRPVASKDSGRRTRTERPRTGTTRRSNPTPDTVAALYSNLLHAQRAHQELHNKIAPHIPEIFGKANLKELEEEEWKRFENMKFAVLATTNFVSDSVVDQWLEATANDKPAQIPPNYTVAFDKLIEEYVAQHNKAPQIEDYRRMYLIVCAGLAIEKSSFGCET